jgi:purine-binding chemotaxis protein CheW
MEAAEQEEWTGGEGPPDEPERTLLVVRVAGALFGFWIDDVLEIVPAPPISRLPLTPDEVPGVTSVRGDILPVLDLGVRLLGAPASREGRLVVVRDPASASLVGLLVDDAETMVSVTEDEVRPPPEAAEAKLPAEFMAGVVTRDEGVITVLRLARVAAPPGPSQDRR